MASKTKVIVAGAGIAGPILAVFLKLKGYDPVVYERTDAVGDAGQSLCMQPNGLRVLSLIPGFMDKLVGKELEKMQHLSALPGENTLLADTDVSGVSQLAGFQIVGVRRSVFHRTIVEVAQSHGVKVVFSHQLVDLKQEADSVEVTFANGATDRASFVVGCDGLHSNTRICLFGNETVTFTGLTQTGGITPTPDVLKDHPRMINVYTDGAHMIAYPVNDKETSWAITRRETEAKEDWRKTDKRTQEAFKEGPWSQWPFGAGELVRSADHIIKYGLYDRPALASWHKGRVALLGDAAHPTSPHLGQGANQAFEDIYHLVRLLTKHNPSAAPPSTALLDDVFSEYEQLRIARTSALVLGARRQGEARVVHGIEACHARDIALKAKYSSADFGRGQLDIYAHPFTGESEI